MGSVSLTILPTTSANPGPHWVSRASALGVLPPVRNILLMFESDLTLLLQAPTVSYTTALAEALAKLPLAPLPTLASSPSLDTGSITLNPGSAGGEATLKRCESSIL